MRNFDFNLAVTFLGHCEEEHQGIDMKMTGSLDTEAVERGPVWYER